MPARIYKPSKTAMQSGQANIKAWVLDFEPEQPRRVEPLMGWTSSGDMRQQLRLRFDSKQEAIAYCEREGIAYQVFEIDAGEKARNVLRGQFFLQTPRCVDALIAFLTFGSNRSRSRLVQAAALRCRTLAEQRNKPFFGHGLPEQKALTVVASSKYGILTP